jgi:hypothetical protein
LTRWAEECIKRNFIALPFVRVKSFYVWNKIGYKTIKLHLNQHEKLLKTQSHTVVRDFNDGFFFLLPRLDGRMIYYELQLTTMKKYHLD